MFDLNWKIGDTLVFENSWIAGKTKIVRETPTTFVLENGDKIRKGRRFPIGQHGFGVECYYSTNEPEGKRILEKSIREKKIRNLSNYNWQNVSDEKIDSILKILEK
jgi:hypothetical protein